MVALFLNFFNVLIYYYYLFYYY